MSLSVAQRAQKIYNTVLDIFDYKKSSDVVTPYNLVKQQVACVSSDATVCVPGAGIGTYVVALIEQGVKPENIYAVEMDQTYYELGSAILERFGVNYVFSDFLEWDPGMRFDAIVGNPPYTANSVATNQTTGGCSKGLDNLFFEKCMELAPYVSLIIRSKHFSKTSSRFRKKLMSSGKMREIRVLPSDVFPGISLTETCVAVFDSDHSGGTHVTFQDGSTKSIETTSDTCLKFTNPDFNPDVPNNLGGRYERGSLNLNELREGSHPMVITMGAKGKDMVVQQVSADQAVCGVNQHGVVMNSKYGGKGFGKVCVKPFSYAVSGSSILLRTNSEEESEKLRDFLMSDSVQELATRNKISNANTKELFKTIPDPLLTET